MLLPATTINIIIVSHISTMIVIIITVITATFNISTITIISQISIFLLVDWHAAY